MPVEAGFSSHSTSTSPEGAEIRTSLKVSTGGVSSTRVEVAAREGFSWVSVGVKHGFK